MSPRDRSPVRTSSPRHPSGKDPWNQWTTYTLTLLCSWNKLLNSCWLEGNWPSPTEPGCSARCFLHSVTPMAVFQFLAGCTPLACSVGGTSFQHNHRLLANRYYKTELRPGQCHIKTKFNNEMHSADNCMLKPVILALFSYLS